MRLQLIVQRHSLPSVCIIWTVGVLRPPYAAAGSSATISQLLEQISEIIPLESEDWGLEDYAVEVRGFECLHFSELNQVLKEDDEVTIRPLQTSDLRFRKVSGRHQISADGKHLIDGVAFGRPFLRRAERPPIRIPPRKRRRLTYDECNDENVDEYAHSRRVMPYDEDFTEEDSEDDDYSAVGDEKDDLSIELEDLRNDIYNDTNRETEIATQDNERMLDLSRIEEVPPRSQKSRKPRRGLGLKGTAMLKLLDENGRPYPREYCNPLLDFYDQAEPVQKADGSAIMQPNRKRKSPRNRKTNLDAEVFVDTPGRLSRRSSSASVKGVRFENIDINTPVTIREFEDSDQSNDGDFEPDGNMDIDTNGSDKENSQPQLEVDEQTLSLVTNSKSNSSISSESESIDDETTSSDASSTITSSDSEPEQFPSTSEIQAGVQKTSSEPSSSSASSESKAGKSSKTRNDEAGHSYKSMGYENHAFNSPTTPSYVDLRPKPPFEGKTQTQKRNQRRRDSKKLHHLKSIGVLSPDATIKELRETKGRNENLDHERKGESQASLADTLNSRKDSLIEAITSDARGLTQESSKNEPIAKKNTRMLPSQINEAEVGVLDDSIANGGSQEEEDIQQTPPGELLSGESSNALAKAKSPELVVRRSKLDLSSSRRLLFGSLGLRTPKTKDDENEIRAKLMKDIKSMQEPKPSKEAESNESSTVPATLDDDSWRDKIILRAVECCHDGIELSTPPFPFVQRWDPQQQISYPNFRAKKKSNRSKKRKRNDEIYYQDNYSQETDDAIIGCHGTASPRIEASFNEDNSELFTADKKPMVPRKDSDDYDTAIHEQLKRETEASTVAPMEVDSTQDLPNLPEDMSICPSLEEDAVKPGTVIAFKQLDMSEATNWQPKVSEYRTALVDCLTDDGLIRMALAKRDQLQKEELYDEKTGERIYSKFEMPGFDDEKTQNVRDVEISYSELIQPKLIQTAEAVSNQEEAHCIVHGGDNLLEDADVVMGCDFESSAINAKTLNPKLPTDTFVEGTMGGTNDNVRQEIFDLIKDAGWRSSLGTNDVEEIVKEHEPGSPTFNGFGSSPPFNTSMKEGVADANIIGRGTADKLSSSQHDNTFEIAESLPAQRITIPNSPLQSPSYNGKENAIKDEEVGEYSLWKEPKHMSDGVEVDLQTSPQEFSSEASLHPPAPNAVETKDRDPQIVSNTSALAPGSPSSDNEFPTLENVFSQIRSSQARSSFEPSLPADEDLSYMEQSSFESKKSTRARTRKSRNGKSKLDGKESISQKSTLFKWDESDEDDETTPGASQAPVHAQIVDLTISSDPVHPPDQSDDDDDYVDDGTQLPSGPGWVKKTRSSLGRFDAFRAGSGRSSRSRSTEAY